MASPKWGRGSFGLGFRMPTWKRGSPTKGMPDRERSDYPLTQKYSGPMYDTDKSKELEPENLRQKVKVYHPGYITKPHREWHLFGRAKHAGEEEVVEKEKVNPESYKRSAEPFTGELHATAKGADLEQAPLLEHAEVYHPGHSYALKIGKRKKTVAESSSEESEDEENRGRAWSIGFKFPSWKRGEKPDKKGKPYADYPVSGKYSGPLEDTSKYKELNPEPIRDHSNVNHSGYSIRPGHPSFFDRWFHPGEEEVVDKEKIDLGPYKKSSEPYTGPLDETKRGNDFDTVPIRGFAKVYHPGRSDIKVKKSKKLIGYVRDSEESSSEDEETRKKRSPSKSGKGFGFNFKLPSWKFGEGEGSPEKEKVVKTEESKQKKAKKYDVFVRTSHPGEVEYIEKEKVRPESYLRSANRYTGPLEDTNKSSDLDLVPIDRYSKVYQPGQSDLKPKKTKKVRTTSVRSEITDEEESMASPKWGRGSFGLGFRMPTWKRGSPTKGMPDRERSDYPLTQKYSGPMYDTDKSKELEPENLRQKVKVYHPGYITKPHREWHLFGRAKHAGEEEVVEKEKVNPESYKRSAEPFTGELHATAKGADLEQAPLLEHAEVYHPGHSYALKIGKRKKTVAESSSEESEDEENRGRAWSIGFKFPSWKRGEKPDKKGKPYADYPVSGKYSGPLEDTSKYKELNPEPIRDHSNVYHSGYSIRPGHPSFFDRWFHPGEEEVVDKEKIDLGPYKKSSEPYTGPLDETKRGNDFDTVPIRGFAKVYHPGRSDIKVKKSKKLIGYVRDSEESSSEDEETRKKRSPSKSGKGFGFNFKLPSWKFGEGEGSPEKEKVVKTEESKQKKAKKYDVFVRTSHPGEVEYIEKEKVRPESYLRSADRYIGPLEDIGKSNDLGAVPLKEHVKVYHDGHSYYKLKKAEKVKKGVNTKISEESDEEAGKSGRSLSKSGRNYSFGLNFKLPKWKRGQKGEKGSPMGDYPFSEEYTGLYDNTTPDQELAPAPLRHQVNIYHSGHSTGPMADRDPQGFKIKFVPLKDEKENDTPRKLSKDAETRYISKKKKDVETGPSAEHSYTLKIDKKKRANDGTSSEDENEERKSGRTSSKSGKGFGFNFHLPNIPKWKQGSKGETPSSEVPTSISDYPFFEKYIGPVDDIDKSKELEPENLRQKWHLFGRAKHAGEEEVVEKEKVNPESYKRSAEPFTGKLHATAKGLDLESAPLLEHAEVYHPGHSYALKIGKRKKTGAESSSEESEDEEKKGRAWSIGFKFPSWKRGEKPDKKGKPYADYPVSEKYSGPLEDTSKYKELNPEPIREHSKVYHSGYSIRPGHPSFFDRWSHPGEEEVVEKEKVDLEPYKKSSEPYTGSVDETNRSNDLDTVPIREFSLVYHPGRSDIKVKKSKKLIGYVRDNEESSSEDKETRKKRSPSKSGKGFGFNFKLPSWKFGEGEGSPEKEKVEKVQESKQQKPKKYDVFIRTADPGDVEYTKKKNVQPESYKRNGQPFTGSLDETNKSSDLAESPLKDYAKVYHDGHTYKKTKNLKKPMKAAEATINKESEPDDGKSGRGMSLNFKIPSWKWGDREKLDCRTGPLGDYPKFEKYSGPLDDVSRNKELGLEPLRETVKVYHTGYSVKPGYWDFFSRFRHTGEEEVVEKEKLKPEAYPKKTKPYAGPLCLTDKGCEVMWVPIQDHSKVYHPGQSYVPELKKKRRTETVSRDSDTSTDDDLAIEERRMDRSPSKSGRRPSFGFNFKLPTWKRSGKNEEPISDYPSSEKYAGPLHDVSKNDELNPEPIRDHSNVYHSGYSIRPGHPSFFDRWFQPGEEEVVDKEKIDLGPYKKSSEPYTGPLDETKRGNDFDTVPIRGFAKVYHPGKSDIKVKKSKKLIGYVRDSEESSSEDEETRKKRSPSKSGKGFGFNFKLPSWKFGEGEGSPEKEKVVKTEESKQKKAKKYDVFVRTSHPGEVEYIEKEKVRPESYLRSANRYTGPLNETEKGIELDTVPIEKHSKVYHFGDSCGKLKKSKKMSTEEEMPFESTSTDSELEQLERSPSKSGRSYSFGLNFKLPNWKRGAKGEKKEFISNYPPTQKYSGPVDDIDKSKELELENLRQKVKVYHPGYTTKPHREWHLFGRAKHAGEEEVVEKEKVNPESYKRSAEPFTGKLHATAKGLDLEQAPLLEHAEVYHPGHSYALKIGKRKKTGAESSSEESEDEEKKGRAWSIGFKFPSWKRGEKPDKKGKPYADYPVSEKYSGPLEDTSKYKELNPEPIRDHSKVYHSGYSIRPGHPSFFDRWSHPGEEEVVEKEKIDLEPYKKSSEPYTGSVNETKRGNDFDTVPIRGFANVYHPGRSDIKVKKSKKTRETTDESEPNSEDEVEEKKEKTPSKSGKGFGFNFKLPSWRRNKRSDYPTFEQYSGPMDDVSRSGELQPSPLRENVSVYHFGRPHKGYDLFIRTSHPGEEETIEKEKVKLESYQRSAMPYVGPVDETHKAADLDLALLKQYSRAYHSGYSSKEPGKWRFSMRSTSAASEDDLNRTFDSVDSVGSSGSSRFGKLKFWRTPDKSSKEAPEPFHPIGFPTNQPHFTGALDSTEKSSELDSGRLRDVVAVYHSGYSESHRPNRKYLMFGRWRHEGEEEVVDKEKVHHESYKRSVEPYAGPLESTSKSEDLAAEPIRRYAAVYHAGKSYIRKSKREKKRRISEVSESSSEEDEPRRVGFHKEPVVVKPSKSLKKTPKEEKKKEEPGEDKKAKSVVIHVKTPSPKKEGKEGKEVVETPKRTKTKSSRRSAGLFGFWRGSARGESPSKQPKTNPKTYYSISEVYSGPLDNTQKWAELGKAPLRSAVDVYHSGQSVGKKSARFAHPGDVDVIEKNLVKPDSYKRSKQPFEGPLDSMQKSSDLENAPLQQHSNVYHDGHSYTKTRQVHKRTASEASYTSTEDAPQAKKHALKLPDTSGISQIRKQRPRRTKRRNTRRRRSSGSSAEWRIPERWRP
ncbi:hypothetical protein L596_007912 [Steinernema carpocapsae]|uniref:Uncharacterized protein n=1 Tax=Steinernema carpocapsae TaxID=34508 RepID=A0A4U5PAT7_STECR|nr:hypothetical protein L596_007912 [Steinernema carpocapsae]